METFVALLLVALYMTGCTVLGAAAYWFLVFRPIKQHYDKTN